MAPTLTQIEQIHKAEEHLRDLWASMEDADWAPGAAVDALHVRASGAWYALAASRVVEVLPACWCDPIPDSPPWVLGTFRIDDESVSVIDLGLRVGGTATQLDPSHLFIRLRVAGGLALWVTQLGEVTELQISDAIPPHSGIPHAPFVIGYADADPPVTVLSVTALSGGTP